MPARLALIVAVVTVAVLGGGVALAATGGHLTTTPTAASTATPPPAEGVRVTSARQLLQRWQAAGIPCPAPKDGDSYYASGTVECGELTIMSFFATPEQLAQQNGALNDFGRDGFLKLEVLEGPNWTIQAETKYLKRAQKVLGGALTDGEHAGRDAAAA